MAAILSPDIEWVIPGWHPLSGAKKGIAEVIYYFSQLQVCVFQAEPMVMGVNDDFLIDCHRNRSNRPDGANINMMSCLLWQFAEGRIIRVRNFPEDQCAVDEFFNVAYSR